MALRCPHSHPVIVNISALGLLNKVKCVLYRHDDAYAAAHNLILFTLRLRFIVFFRTLIISVIFRVRSLSWCGILHLFNPTFQSFVLALVNISFIVIFQIARVICLDAEHQSGPSIYNLFGKVDNLRHVRYVLSVEPHDFAE